MVQYSTTDHSELIRVYSKKDTSRTAGKWWPTSELIKNRVYVKIKCQLDTTEVFIADLIACSTCFGHHYAHHQELKSIIQWLLPVVFRAVVFKLLVWCGVEGYVSGLQDAAVSCKPDT